MSGSVWSGLEKTAGGGEAVFGDGALTAEVTAVLEGGNRLIRFTYEGYFFWNYWSGWGKMPLPPYIKEELQDAERYQIGLFSGGWLCGSPYGGPAFYQRSAGFH